MKMKTFTFFIALFFAINFQVSAQESTTNLLKKAQIEAKKTGKKIFVKFEASWCGWCHRMTKNMKAARTKKFFNENFILVPVVVKESPNNKKLENPGGDQLIKKYNNGNSRVGLPFWFILDADLKMIVDSYDANKQNLGCPASPEEVEVFIQKLRKHAPRFKNEDAEIIRLQFVKKK